MDGILNRRLLGRMMAGVERGAKARGVAKHPKPKLSILIYDQGDGYLRRVAIGYHMVDGILLSGEVMATQMTSVGVESGETTIVHRGVIHSSGIDRCVASLPSQNLQRRETVGLICLCHTVMIGGVMAVTLSCGIPTQNPQRTKVVGMACQCLKVMIGGTSARRVMPFQEDYGLTQHGK